MPQLSAILRPEVLGSQNLGAWIRQGSMHARGRDCLFNVAKSTVGYSVEGGTLRRGELTLDKMAGEGNDCP